jgi:hypothetical protein
LRDGLKKRLRFADSRIDIEAERGEIESATVDASGRSLTLEMGDSTGLIHSSQVLIKGLAPGEYQISYGVRTEARPADAAGMILEWPLQESARIVIERMGTR